MPYITAIGLGSMGTALATAFLDASTQLTIWNRSADRPSVQSLVAAGATFEPKIETAIAAPSDAITFCVVDYPAIYELLRSLPAGLLKGKTVINLTNGTPKQAEEMEAWMTKQGVSTYIDGAVMVTPAMVNTPHSLLVYSGQSQERMNSVLHLVTPLGKALYFGEKVSAAAAVDLAALSGMYGMFLGGFLGMSLLQKTGLKTLPGTEQVMAPTVSALVGFLTQMAGKADEGDWLGGSENPMAMQLAGVNNIREALEDAGLDGTMFEVLGNIFKQTLKVHGEDASLAAITSFTGRRESS